MANAGVAVATPDISVVMQIAFDAFIGAGTIGDEIQMNFAKQYSDHSQRLHDDFLYDPKTGKPYSGKELDKMYQDEKNPAKKAKIRAQQKYLRQRDKQSRGGKNQDNKTTKAEFSDMSLAELRMIVFQDKVDNQGLSREEISPHRPGEGVSLLRGRGVERTS